MTPRDDQLRITDFEPDMKRLAKLTAPERAKVYSLAGLDPFEREAVEAEVRARIATELLGGEARRGGAAG